MTYPYPQPQDPIRFQEISWVLNEPVYVTRLEIGQDDTAVLVARTQGPRAPSDAFVVSTSIDDDVLINGYRVELGDDTIAFLSIMDEAVALVSVGDTYLSDPNAG
jgi:hypothetical protein